MPLGTDYINIGENLKGWNNEQSAGNQNNKPAMLWVGSSETICFTPNRAFGLLKR